jgi:LAO/AO transport system kinase
MNTFEDFKKKDLRTLARLITLCEDGSKDVLDTLSQIYELPGHAKVIGITGPPGAGKSTLINTFVKLVRKKQQKVAVLAVDPVSPFSGGALLGDRIRLTDHFNDPNVFIRSVSTRGKLGGLSLATRQGITLLDRFGFDFIIVETVGVGQSEVDVRKVADVTLVALVPEWGDSIQALKAGILEIADIFVVNKADREGADRIETELKNILHISGRDETPVLKTTFNDLATVDKLFSEVESYLNSKKTQIEKKRREAVTHTALELLDHWVIQEAGKWIRSQKEPSSNPYEIIKKFQEKFPEGTLFS